MGVRLGLAARRMIVMVVAVMVMSILAASMVVAGSVALRPMVMLGMVCLGSSVVVMSAMPMIVVVTPVSYGVVTGRVVGSQPHVHAQAVDAVSGILADFQMKFLIQTKLGQFGPQEVGGYAQAEHGGQVHVAG